MKTQIKLLTLLSFLILMQTYAFPNTFNVSIPDIEVTSDQASVTIPIIIADDLTGQGVTSYTGNISWDNTVITNPSANQAGTLTENWGTSGYQQNNSTPGKLIFGQFAADPALSGNGTLVSLTFDIVGEAGDNTAITFNMFSLKGQSAGTVDGSVTIKSQTSAITITAPNGGEHLYVGTDRSITWSSSGTSGQVMIQLSRNGAETWETLFANTTDDQVQSWPVTGPGAVNCLLKITDCDGSPSDISDARFSIFDTYFYDNFQDGIADGWLPRTPNRWSVVRDEGDYSYLLNATGYQTDEYSVIKDAIFKDFELSVLAKSAENLQQTSSANYAIIFGYQDPANLYYLKFCSYNPENKLYRTINGRTVVLASYNGPTIVDNCYHLIQLIRNGNQIGVCFDGTQIMTASDGTFDNGKIALGSYKYSAYFDEVLITEVDRVPRSITLTEPNGGETWCVGQTHKIRWTSDKYVGDVIISISTTNGETWWKLPDGYGKATPNAGEYAFTPVDANISQYCLFEISPVENPAARDRSDNVFTIKTGSANVPDIAVNPNSMNYGTLQVGNYLDQTFIVSNTGLANLNIISTTLEGGDASQFSIQSGDEFYMLTPGETREVVVRFSPTTVGSKSASLRFLSNDPDESPLDAALSGTGSSNGGNLPDHWNFTDKTGNNATVVLLANINPDIEGAPLENGDDIGIFTASGLCCGHARWQTGQNLSLTAWGDNELTDEIDGFKSGELICYRVYRIREQKEWFAVAVAYSEGTGLYSAGAYMVLNKFTASGGKSATLNFSQGWNMFSINVNPLDPALATVMAPIIDKLKIMKNGRGQTFIPEYGINMIGDINFKEGYQAYLSAAATLNVTGQAVNATTPIALPAGWSIISYLPDTAIDAAIALSAINSLVKIVKNSAGQVYIPRYGINNIGQMEPGQGYEIYMNAAAELIYPSGDNLLSTAISPEVNKQTDFSNTQTKRFQFSGKTGENAIIVIPVDCEPRYSNGTPLEAGAEIGVFTSEGRCCGAAVWSGGNTALTVWADNSHTDSLDGFQAGEQFCCRIYNKSNGTEYPVSISYHAGHSPGYQPNGFSVLTKFAVEPATDIANAADSDLPAEYQLLRNYPNPFNPETVIGYSLPKSEFVQLHIYNALGQRIRTLLAAQQHAGDHRISWDSRNDAGEQVADGIYFYRIVTRGFAMTRKMLLLR